jgi:L-serine dehydratase
LGWELLADPIVESTHRPVLHRLQRLGERVSAVVGVHVDLYGRLAATGRGHGTPGAILLGLGGETGRERVAAIDGGEPLLVDDVTPGALTTAGVDMRPTEIKNRHTNAIRFAVDFSDGGSHEAMYYSIGGGFVMRDGQPPEPPAEVPLRFTTGDELLKLCEEQDVSMWEIVWRNECALRSSSGVRGRVAADLDGDGRLHRRGFPCRGGRRRVGWRGGGGGCRGCIGS